jgi:phosphate transport system ATP-binding protein
VPGANGDCAMEKIRIEHLSIMYSDGTESLKDINLVIEANAITVLFGPAGGGKSTLLRTLNRLNDLAEVREAKGLVWFNGMNIMEPHIDVVELRRKVGIVFSRPVPLPLTIYGNISFTLEMAGERNKARLDEIVEKSLRQAMLWDEVNDRLQDPAAALSGGQQQRLCLARVLALQPEVIMLDEPTSALDPIATAKIEGMLQELKLHYTIIVAPHNVQQSARVADFAAFFLQGDLIEYGTGTNIFMNPKDKRTEDYIEGRFG